MIFWGYLTLMKKRIKLTRALISLQVSCFQIFTRLGRKISTEGLLKEALQPSEQGLEPTNCSRHRQVAVKQAFQGTLLGGRSRLSIPESSSFRCANTDRIMCFWTQL